MTKYDQAWVAAEEAKRQWMEENSLFRDEHEHSSCGVGLVVAKDGQPSRKVVQAGINALKAIWHRGAVDADGMLLRALAPNELEALGDEQQQQQQDEAVPSDNAASADSGTASSRKRRHQIIMQ